MKRFFVVLLQLISLNAWGFDLKNDIPPQAFQYFPTLKSQIQQSWPDMPAPYYFGALIEHESGCPSIPKFCWNPNARLKTSREEGAGLGQITRAFRPDGSTRFDALTDARRLDPRGLNALRWETIYQRPDLQMRVMVLMVRENYYRLLLLVPDSQQRLAMTDAAYNGGLGGVINERRACALKAGCNPNIWLGHVENTCLKSKRPLYGTRSACDINRHHVADVIYVRMHKYQNVM